MRRRGTRAGLIVAIALATVSAACGSGRQVSLEVEDPPQRIAGNVLTLPVRLSGLEIVKADGDTSGTTGHFHVFVDRRPGPEGRRIPKEKGIVHSTDNPIVIPGLTVGTHTLTVVLGDGAHARILDSVAEQVVVDVAGPALQASAPATSAVGQPVPVTIGAQGFTVGPADGDTSGRTGHFHLFVDRPPTAAGQAIPREAGIIHTTETTVQVPGLPRGDHTIWVVAGDGAHVPLQPMVAAKVAVAVA